MKKIIFGLFLLFSFSAASQAQVFSQGDKVVNVGIGFGSYLGGSGYSIIIPPLAGSFEYGIVDGLINGNASIGVGGYLGFASEKTFDWHYNYFILGARGAFHYQFVDKLDTYAGLILGYNITSSSGSGIGVNNNSLSGFAYSTFVGARYYFTESIAAFAEIGYGISILQLGVAIKL
ncbi:MAG: hypothetical protein LBH80_04300 [Prevotellaceae bacterium]|jgi:hypothetical protein|nr:hypothetical protein [Prevotellaceae bacterium]